MKSDEVTACRCSNDFGTTRNMGGPAVWAAILRRRHVFKIESAPSNGRRIVWDASSTLGNGETGEQPLARAASRRDRHGQGGGRALHPHVVGRPGSLCDYRLLLYGHASG